MTDLKLLAASLLASSVILSISLFLALSQPHSGPGRFVPVTGKDYFFIIDTQTGEMAGQIKIY